MNEPKILAIVFPPEKKEIIETLEERLDLVSYLEDKIRAYRNWREFAMKECESLRRKLKNG